MEAKIVYIKDLCPSCINRWKAKEAASRLIGYVQNAKPLVIDLGHIEILSFSFLDELIFWLAASANMRNVIFRIDNATLKDKLARIVAIRNVDLYYQYNGKPAILLKPKKLHLYKTTFQMSKKLLKP